MVAASPLYRKRVAALAIRDDLPWDALDRRSFIVTGATGLIGRYLIETLLARREQTGMPLTLSLLVRDVAAARQRFGEGVALIPWSLGDPIPPELPCDYFIHGASPTDSRSFVASPFETLTSIVEGARQVVEFARDRSLSKLLFLSTMEVYGETTGVVTESDWGALDPLIVRNSYPEAKRCAEALMAAAAHEFKIPAVIARLAQTFGEGVARDDRRVFAEFGRAAACGDDITLLTDGSTRNVYVSLSDATRAILTLLASGEPGQAYNVANEATYCSIAEMAALTLEDFGGAGARVVKGAGGDAAGHFRKSSNLLLSAAKLQALGWRPEEDLKKMYQVMLDDWSQTDGDKVPSIVVDKVR